MSAVLLEEDGDSPPGTMTASRAPRTLAAMPPTATGRVDGLKAWATDHPAVVDGTVGLVLLVLGVALVQDASIYPEDMRAPDPLGYALMVGMTLPLAWRRRRPEVVLALTLACMLPLLVLGYRDAFASFGPLVALYTLAAHVDRPRSLWVGGTAIAAFSAVIVLGVFSEGEDLPPAAAVANIGMVIGVFAIGDALRSRRAYVAELQRRVETGDRLRQEEAALAVAAERARIARELHDVVAHGMSVMVVQAGAARRVVDRDPAAAAQALGQIEQTGRESMGEMRRLLGVLRDEAGASGATDDLAPQPSLADVGALVSSWQDAGLAVTCGIDGPLDDLPAGLGLSAYRIVQEALTNAVRHAGPATVRVAVRRSPDALALEIVDDGRGAATLTGPPPTDGHGIVGMRERAAVHGGTLEAGPRPGGGWRIRAELPLDEGVGGHAGSVATAAGATDLATSPATTGRATARGTT